MQERHAFLMLYRLRRANFRAESFMLYRRYAHGIVIFLALFGMMLTERPSLLAEPLLHFWRSPQLWHANLYNAGGWLATVAIWVSVHRDPISGGAMAVYARSLPLAARAGAGVDAMMLLRSLQIFLIPAALALWFAFRSGHLAGVDDLFCLYLAVFAGLTVSVAKSTAFGAALRSRLIQFCGLAALVFSQQLPEAATTLALSVALLASVADAVTPIREGVFRTRGKQTKPRTPSPNMALLRMQLGLLVHRHGLAAATRLCLAALPQWACWWLIMQADKAADARVFIELACAATVGLSSGLFYTLLMARKPLQPYLRSTAWGASRVALAEQQLVLAATGLLLSASLLAFTVTLGARAVPTTDLLQASLYWLACLPVLGVAPIQRHKNGVPIKFGVLAFALLIRFNV